jgi:hypothetical protein
MSTPQEMLQIIRSKLENPLEIHHFDQKNHSVVKVTVFVQDNGFQSQVSPLEHAIFNKDETSTMNFITRDYPDPGWQLMDVPVTKYLEKQPHVCILSNFDASIGLEKLNLKESIVKQKLPGFDSNGVCVVKTIGPMLPLNQMVQVIGYFERPIEQCDDLLFSFPVIHCVDFQILGLKDLIPPSVTAFDPS